MLGLSVPTTWDQFISNSEKIKAAGIIPVLAVLRGHLDQPALRARRLRERQRTGSRTGRPTTRTTRRSTSTRPRSRASRTPQQVFDMGLMNKDYASLTNAALKALATGTGGAVPDAHRGDLQRGAETTRARSTTSATSRCRLRTRRTPRATIWEPNAIVHSEDDDRCQARRGQEVRRLRQLARGLRRAEHRESSVAGPYAISTCTVPSNAPALVADETDVPDRRNNRVLALEFISPIKGPNLEKILVQVGSGITRPPSRAPRSTTTT